MDLSPQQQWLRRFVGEWSVSGTGDCGQDQPPMTYSGRETVRMIGEHWIHCESHATLGDNKGEMTSVLTLGYDPARERFVGSWFGSPMAFMFIYEGVLRDNVLPLDTKGPSMVKPGELARYQDVLEMHEGDRRVLWSQMQLDDGTWQKIMRAEYVRIR